MKCPVCGEELKSSQKDPNYLLCYTCKKKFKAPQKEEMAEKQKKAPKKAEPAPKERPQREKSQGERPRREKTQGERPQRENPQRERVQKERPQKEGAKRKAKEEQTYSNIPPKEVREKREKEMRQAYDDLLAVEDDRDPSKAPIIILLIAILIVAGVIAYMLFF